MNQKKHRTSGVKEGSTEARRVAGYTSNPRKNNPMELRAHSIAEQEHKDNTGRDLPQKITTSSRPKTHRVETNRHVPPRIPKVNVRARGHAPYRDT